MDLREKTIEYLKENGIKKKHLASVIGICPCQLSEWLNAKCELNSERIKIIENFIKK